jgi:hypothetical protein
VETSIISGDPPEMRLYLSDDYGGGYVGADLAGNVTNVVPRG